QAVRQLVLITGDDLIAGLLNRNGLKTGNGNRWTRERVASLRSHHHIPVFKPADDGIEPWLNLGNAAKLLKIAPKTLRLAAQAGQIEAFHLSAIQPHDDVGVEQVEANGGDNEQVHGGNILSMITQKSAPTVAARSAAPEHLFGDTRLRDLKSEIEQLAVNARRSPKRILRAH